MLVLSTPRLVVMLIGMLIGILPPSFICKPFCLERHEFCIACASEEVFRHGSCSSSRLRIPVGTLRRRILYFGSKPEDANQSTL